MCGKNDQKATKKQIRDNLEAAKRFATIKWGIYSLADGRFTGEGYGYTIEDKPQITDHNICVIG